MAVLMLVVGAMSGFMIGYLMGFCRADNMHHRVKNQDWRGDIPKSRKPPPKPLYNPCK